LLTFFIVVKVGLFLISVSVVGSAGIACNVLQLQEVGDFEAQNFLPPQNLTQSTKLHLPAGQV